MRSNPSIALHHFLRAVILLGFTLYIVHLTKTGNLAYYIAPRTEIYVKCAAIVLYAISAYQVYRGVRSLRSETASDCDCGHELPRSSFANLVVYGLFIVPLLLGFLLPDAPMGSSIAAKKGMNLSGDPSLLAGAPAAQPEASPAPAKTSPGAGPAQPGSSVPPSAADSKGDATKGGASNGVAPKGDVPQSNSPQNAASKSSSPPTDEQLQEMFKTDKYNEDFGKLGIMLYKKDMIHVQEDLYMEILTAVSMFKENYIGKKIDVSGFVYREDGMKDNQFVVGRFAVSCCSADATPYGVMVEFGDAQKFAKDTWVKVTGTIGTTAYNDNEIVKINATKVEKIQPAKTPYIYPQIEFLDKLQ